MSRGDKRYRAFALCGYIGTLMYKYIEGGDRPEPGVAEAKLAFVYGGILGVIDWTRT